MQARRADLTAGERDALEAFARQARTQFGVEIERILLFGSRARGDAGESSDIDVLVVVSATSEREGPLRRALRDLASDIELAHVERMRAPLSLVVISADALAELQQRERVFALDVQSEGVAL